MNNDIGVVIRRKRIERCMKQKELARKVNVSVPSVSDWERGVNTPSIQNLKKIERILSIGVLTKEFVNGDKNE